MFVVDKPKILKTFFDTKGERERNTAFIELLTTAKNH